MTRAIIALRAVTGLLWLAQLVLGVFFWTGHALALVQLHMTLGLLFVLGLWATAALCWRAGAPAPLAAATLLLGAVIPVLGYAQVQLVPGEYHWVVRVVHFLLGIAAMPLLGRLSLLIGRRSPTPQVVGRGPQEARAANG